MSVVSDNNIGVDIYRNTVSSSSNSTLADEFPCGIEDLESFVVVFSHKDVPFAVYSDSPRSVELPIVSASDSSRANLEEDRAITT